MMKLWNTLTSTGIKESTPHLEARSIRLSNRLALLISLMLIAYILPSTLESSRLLPFIGLSVLLYLLTLLLNKAGRYEAAGLYIIIISILDNIAISIIPGPGSGEIYYFIAIGLLPMLLLKKPWLIYTLTILNALVFLATFKLQGIIGPVIEINDEYKPIFLQVNIVILLVLVFLSLLYFRRDSEHYERRLEKVNAELALKNKEITDSIRYAGRLQSAILPSGRTVSESLPENFIFFKPKDIVSGDFYWVESEGSKRYFAAVDCTGHGVPGAMVSVVGHIGLNRVLKEFRISQPSRMLDKLSQLVIDTFVHSEEEIKDGMDIALCCLDLETMTLEYAGANNSLYLLRNNEVLETKADRQPVGKYSSARPFTNHSIHLQKGDCLYLYSDGFADQFGGEAGKKYKYSRFKELLLSYHSEKMDRQKTFLENAFDEWKGDLEQVDDVCVIGVRV